MAAFFGSFIFAFLLIFKPFELDHLPSSRMLFIAFIYGLITFSCVFAATYLGPKIFPETFREPTWTAGKQIVFTGIVIFLVGLGNYLVSPWLVHTSLHWGQALWFQGITLAIGLLPVSIFILFQQNRLLKRFSREAAVLEQKLQEKQETDLPVAEEEKFLQSRLVFTSDYANEKLELYPDDLYFITAASNYIKIFHFQKGKLVYSILRSTLRMAEEILVAFPNFFKCHRAYIVNLDKVEHVEGNAQGYKIRIDGYEEPIPVSRNLSNEFSDKLLAFRSHVPHMA